MKAYSPLLIRAVGGPLLLAGTLLAPAIPANAAGAASGAGHQPPLRPWAHAAVAAAERHAASSHVRETRPGSVSAQGNSGNADDWDGEFFSGSGGGARGPFTLHGGRYHVYVSAFYNGLHTMSSSCAFTARLEGVEHPLPPAFANLGTAIPLSDSGYVYQLPLTIAIDPGHYSVIVSPFTNCDWSVSILGGIPVGQPLAIGPVGITRTADDTGKSITSVHLHESVDLSALYDTRDAAARPTGTVTLARQGRTVRTLKLTRGPTAGGVAQMHHLMAFGDGDRSLIGPLTARFTLRLGAATATRSVDFTLGDGNETGALAITDVGVFAKVGDHYPATTTVHLTDQTGFTVTYSRDGGGGGTPRGSLSIVRHGTVAYTFPLTTVTTGGGKTGFYTIIHWDPSDQALLGPLTARATVTLGNFRVSRSVNFTLIR